MFGSSFDKIFETHPLRLIEYSSSDVKPHGDGSVHERLPSTSPR
jgi:hypothetical protein